MPAGGPLDWGPCETAPGWECATAAVPKVYGSRAEGASRWPSRGCPRPIRSNKIGSLFINYGGPGVSAVDITQAIGADLFAAFRERFDLVAFDPRGTGATSQAIDCQAQPGAAGAYSQPFFEPGDDLGAYLRRIGSYWERCQALNPAMCCRTRRPANYARDMDRLRRSVGDRRLTYFGFSYGTFIGETYAALFPHRFRALVLDGALDPDQYINRPMSDLRVQTAGFEKAFGRFMMTCAPPGFLLVRRRRPVAGLRQAGRASRRVADPGGRQRSARGRRRGHPGRGVGTLYSKFAWTDLALRAQRARGR